mmetsp:Transcript_26424/g.29446  ORF Transcript_26424/g.29446 Transcript_26424/m.29446 type:complete len:216 (+) Transcript_26424:2532-3179(+)
MPLNSGCPHTVLNSNSYVLGLSFFDFLPERRSGAMYLLWFLTFCFSFSILSRILSKPLSICCSFCSHSSIETHCVGSKLLKTAGSRSLEERNSFGFGFGFECDERVSIVIIGCTDFTGLPLKVWPMVKGGWDEFTAEEFKRTPKEKPASCLPSHERVSVKSGVVIDVSSIGENKAGRLSSLVCGCISFEREFEFVCTRLRCVLLVVRIGVIGGHI